MTRSRGLLCFNVIAFVILWGLLCTVASPLDLTKTLPLKKLTACRKKHHAVVPEASRLSFDHYAKTCPDAEAIIQQKVFQWLTRDPTLAPAIIRLHFHDCAGNGCEGSILLDSPGGERRASVSRTLRGFEVIDDIKKELELRCPRTVSCADILTSAARDATTFAGGPFWQVPFGRRDSKVSLAAVAEKLPQGHEDVTYMIQFFNNMGLDILDMLTLLGAHTIGRCSCSTINDRIRNFKGTGKPDPILSRSFLRLLLAKCPQNSSNLVFLDVITPKVFDTVFYTNLQKNIGLLTTDQELNMDQRTIPYVQVMASQPFIFSSQFSSSMVKLGNVGVITGPDEGEIRLNCNFVNPR